MFRICRGVLARCMLPPCDYDECKELIIAAATAAAAAVVCVQTLASISRRLSPTCYTVAPLLRQSARQSDDYDGQCTFWSQASYDASNGTTDKSCRLDDAFVIVHLTGDKAANGRICSLLLEICSVVIQSEKSNNLHECFVNSKTANFTILYTQLQTHKSSNLVEMLPHEVLHYLTHALK